ncbi:MAG: alpha/beta hydrolase [Syntrophus sp. (in: bacteria)]|nr:alpha/beta hydrolase [Syntrophus sp. (in: bacteria)]
MTLSRQTFNPEEAHIYIPEIEGHVFDFIRKIWHAFVNKMVSLAFTERDYCFEYGLFEVIDGKFMRTAAVSSQIRLDDIAKRKVPKEFAEFKKKTRPAPVSYQSNFTARVLRKAVINRGRGKEPPIVLVNLKTDKRTHPRLKEIVADDMNYAVGITLFFGDHPIGVLWGIRSEPLSAQQRARLYPQLRSLSSGISTIMALEFNGGRHDHRSARMNIEKLDTNAVIVNLFYTRQDGQSTPVRSIIGRSTRYKSNFRLDASYIVPTSQGCSISLKRFLPEHENKTGKTLLMIPGFFCKRSIFDLLAREMAFRCGYKVISLDYRGRSGRTLPESRFYKAWSIDDFIQEDFPKALAWIREQYPDDRVVVFGHSMGGIIARFYAGSFKKIQALTGREDLPEPASHMAGIVSIASPDYLDVKLGIPGADLLKLGARIIPDAFDLNTISGNIFNKILSGSISTVIPTINLKTFFTFLHDIHGSMRQLTFDVSTRIFSLQDFIGFPQVTPPEVYMLMEDIICEESTRVMIQFFRSQFFGNSIQSFDGRINYTGDLKNITLPVFHIMGSLDVIAPPDTIRPGHDRIASAGKRIKEYKQGHLGLILHHDTVRDIAASTDRWICKL